LNCLLLPFLSAHSFSHFISNHILNLSSSFLERPASVAVVSSKFFQGNLAITVSVTLFKQLMHNGASVAIIHTFAF
jgi:hypothetical protein